MALINSPLNADRREDGGSRTAASPLVYWVHVSRMSSSNAGYDDLISPILSSKHRRLETILV